PASSRARTATPSTGKSNEPRRRSLTYAERSPSAGGGTWTEVKISSRRRVRYAMPSSANSSLAGMRRSPAVDASVTSAPSAHRTGAVSDDDTAQHRGELGATQQVSPSFFMQ